MTVSGGKDGFDRDGDRVLKKWARNFFRLLTHIGGHVALKSAARLMLEPVN
jgi:hypothetical protein